MVATMALFYSFVPTFAESLSSKQTTVAGAWAQSSAAPDQESTAGEKEKITPAGEQEKVQAEKQEGVPEADQGSARPEEADQKEKNKQDQGEEEGEEGAVVPWKDESGLFFRNFHSAGKFREETVSHAVIVRPEDETPVPFKI